MTTLFEELRKRSGVSLHEEPAPIVLISEKKLKQLTRPSAVLDGIILMTVWIAMLLACLATWYWVIAGIVTHLAILK